MVRSGKSESAASAKFSVFLVGQSANSDGELAKTLHVSSRCHRKEKQPLYSFEGAILKAEGRSSQKMTLNLGNCMERRQRIRFAIRVEVNFKWLDGKGVLRQGRGFTRDISQDGLFIYSDAPVPTKADLQVEVFFNSIHGAKTNLRLRTRALVLRGEQATRQGKPHGFALLNRNCKVFNGLTPIED